MSADNFRSVCISSNDHLVRRRDVFFWPSSQVCVGNVDSSDNEDSGGSTPSPLKAPLSGKSVVAPVSVAKYIKRFVFVLGLELLAIRHNAPRW